MPADQNPGAQIQFNQAKYYETQGMNALTTAAADAISDGDQLKTIVMNGVGASLQLYRLCGAEEDVSRLQGLVDPLLDSFPTPTSQPSRDALAAALAAAATARANAQNPPVVVPPDPQLTVAAAITEASAAVQSASTQLASAQIQLGNALNAAAALLGGG